MLLPIKRAFKLLFPASKRVNQLQSYAETIVPPSPNFSLVGTLHALPIKRTISHSTPTDGSQSLPDTYFGPTSSMDTTRSYMQRIKWISKDGGRNYDGPGQFLINVSTFDCLCLFSSVVLAYFAVKAYQISRRKDALLRA